MMYIFRAATHSSAVYTASRTVFEEEEEEEDEDEDDDDEEEEEQKERLLVRSAASRANGVPEEAQRDEVDHLRGLPVVLGGAAVAAPGPARPGFLCL